jgi:hypothetical protein
MSFELSADQRMFMDLYAHQYNQICDQSNRMQEQIQRNSTVLNELRYNIQTIYGEVSTRLMRNDISRRHPLTSSTIPSSFATYTSSFALPISCNLMMTETSRHIFADIECPLNTECPISLEPFEPNAEVAQINRCGHIFNRNELSHWFQTNSRCPTCRTETNFTT